jgi:hypothetical protein
VEKRDFATRLDMVRDTRSPDIGWNKPVEYYSVLSVQTECSNCTYAPYSRLTQLNAFNDPYLSTGTLCLI